MARRRAAAGIFLLALIAGYALMVAAPWARWQSLRHDAAQLEHQLATRSTHGVSAEATEAIETGASPAAPASAAWLASRLPVDDDGIGLLDALDRLADAHDVRIESLRPLPVVQHDGYRAVPVQLRASGAFHAIAAFVEAIGHMPRLADLHDLALTPADASRITLDVQVRAYAVGDETSQPAGAPRS